MIVGKVALSTAIGVPTLTVIPSGAVKKARSAAETVEKLTGLLNVNVTALGDVVTVAPLAGLVAPARRRSTALIELMALTRPKPSAGLYTPAGVPFNGVAPAIKPARISAGVR